LELKQLYHKLFRSREKMASVMEQARKDFASAPAKVLLEFVASAKHGVCRDTGLDGD
jgi:acyl-[acyl carrier protein]--UDP-N-acetylglucosamine O-acyltransferase